MWSAIQRSSRGRRVTGVNFNTLQDEYNLIKFMITQNNSVGRFFNVSMMESMASPNTALQDMYDGYRGDFSNMESRFNELTGIEAAMRTKLEDSGYYGVSEEEWYNESDYESDTSTQILSGTDNESDAEADSNDEGDEYYEDNSATNGIAMTSIGTM